MKQHLRSIIDVIPEFISYVDAEFRYQFVNKAYEVQFGMKEADIQGKKIRDIIGPQAFKRAESSIKKALKGEACHYENMIIGTDGQQRDTEVQCIPLEGGVILLGHDITESKRRHDQLKFLAEAADLLGSSLDYQKTLTNLSRLAVPRIADWCAIDLLEEDGKIRSVSVAHIDPEKLKLAKELRIKVPQDPDSLTGVPGVIRSGKPEFYPVITEEMLMASTQDEDILKMILQVGFTSVMIVPLEARGRVMGALTLVSAESKKVFTKDDLDFAEELATRAGIAVDNARLFQDSQAATEEVKRLNTNLEKRVKERTAELMAANQELNRSNAELQDFAYVASHDLQEPLRKITSFSNLLLTTAKDTVSEEGKQHIAIIQKAARRMSTLINDLLDYSRVTTKAQPFGKVTLQSLVKEVLEDLQVQIEQSKAMIEVGKLPQIKGDPLQMRMLFQNIISNALKYHQEGLKPRIRVEAKEKGENHEISIEDNGIGFDEVYLEKIFTIFQRLHGKDSYDGTGIGLAICKKIVERHGGSITAHSQEGHGSAFIISLPKQY